MNRDLLNQVAPVVGTEFDETLWVGLVDHVTVYGKDGIRFTLVSGVEIAI